MAAIRFSAARSLYVIHLTRHPSAAAAADDASGADIDWQTAAGGYPHFAARFDFSRCTLCWHRDGERSMRACRLIMNARPLFKPGRLKRPRLRNRGTCCLTGVVPLLMVLVDTCDHVTSAPLRWPYVWPYGAIKILLFLLFFIHSVSIPRGGFKNWWKWLKGYDAQSVQSGTGRLLCSRTTDLKINIYRSVSRTALKRCISTETRWYKWLISLVSPEIEEILLPSSFRSRMADALKTPKVSTAIGSNMWRPTIPAYFTSLRVAANSAAAPASRAASVTCDSAKGQDDTVTSQHNDSPLCHGTSVRPSGLFPSDRNSPMGSFCPPAQSRGREN